MKWKIHLVKIFQKFQSTKLYRKIRFSFLVDKLVIPSVERLDILKREISDEQILKILNIDNPTIIEVGADSGSDTVKMSNLFKGGTIYSFEPDPRNIPRVLSRISNLDNVTLIEKALSNVNGKSIFNLSQSSKTNGGQGSSSLKKPKLTSEVFPEIIFSDQCEVECITLDDFVYESGLRLIDFIWMDVQGAEDIVIKGGYETFKNKVHYLYTEFSNIELYEGQMNLQDILELLPSYEVIDIFTSNVLLRNKNFVR